MLSLFQQKLEWYGLSDIWRMEVYDLSICEERQKILKYIKLPTPAYFMTAPKQCVCHHSW